MNANVVRAGLTTTAILAVSAGALAPFAQAARPGQTVKVRAKQAYVDNRAPGRVFSGTVFRGDPFKIIRTARVTHGSAKGLWYYGTARVSGANSHGAITSFKLTGWVNAVAFS
jgi:hypothetical protein